MVYGGSCGGPCGRIQRRWASGSPRRPAVRRASPPPRRPLFNSTKRIACSLSFAGRGVAASVGGARRFTPRPVLSEHRRTDGRRANRGHGQI
ncbi:hypothetical protein EVAR_103718_1 [Eumeta japonica]|uniref:Uncharacterized protein n=1 Tax=Eumeta variegata TaxID=151549 RepID=A0A4C1ZG79_EUMVA|nr:hypothetical protein EVAR_103718_1 [Eumeta japonica]